MVLSMKTLFQKQKERLRNGDRECTLKQAVFHEQADKISKIKFRLDPASFFPNALSGKVCKRANFTKPF